MTRSTLGLVALISAALCIPPATAEPGYTFTPENRSELEAALSDGTYGTVTSVLILQDGQTVYETYLNGADETTRHNTRSVTKTITGMGVGLAVAEGVLSVDDRAAPYFADIAPFDNPDPRKLAITVEDLLTMSSMMECDDWNSFSRGNEERMYIVDDWRSFFWDLPVRGYPSWATKPKDAKYGRAYSYCTAGVQMLGEIVEAATGKPFTDYVETNLFGPLGIDNLTWPRNGEGQAHIGGGLELTSRSLATLAELQRNGGLHEGKRILPQDWTDAAVSPHAAIPGGDGWEYGYLWWLWPYEVEGEQYWAAMMNGNGGNRVAVFPDFGLTVVLTKTDYNTRGMHQQADEFMQQVIVAGLNR